MRLQEALIHLKKSLLDNLGQYFHFYPMKSDNVNCPKELDCSKKQFEFRAVLSRRTSNIDVFSGNISANSLMEYIEYDDIYSLGVGDIVQDCITNNFYTIQSIEYTARATKKAFLQKASPVICIIPQYSIGGSLPIIIAGELSPSGGAIGSTFPVIFAGTNSDYRCFIGNALPLITAAHNTNLNSVLGADLPLILVDHQKINNYAIGSLMPIITT